MSSRKWFFLMAIGLCIAAVATVSAQADKSPAKTKVNDPDLVRWQIREVEMSYSGTDDDRSAVNTILLDIETGDSWVLWPGDDQAVPYSWIKIPRK
jgi:hypothetical protein